MEIKDFYGYTGKVSCKLKINNKIVNINSHNSGFPELFRIIAKALAGYSITKEKPVYLDIRKKISSGNETTYETVLKNKAVLVGGAYVEDNSNWCTVFNATIDRYMINDNSKDYNGTLYAYLISGTNEDLAETTISNIGDSNIIQKVKGGNNIQALFEWKMYVTNPTETSDSTQIENDTSNQGEQTQENQENQENQEEQSEEQEEPNNDNER